MLGEVPERNEVAADGAVRVEAPARLHFGFLDLHGGLGRRFGSIGLAIDAPSLALSARRAARPSVEGPKPTACAAMSVPPPPISGAARTWR